MEYAELSTSKIQIHTKLALTTYIHNKQCLQLLLVGKSESSVGHVMVPLKFPPTVLRLVELFDLEGERRNVQTYQL